MTSLAVLGNSNDGKYDGILYKRFHRSEVRRDPSAMLQSAMYDLRFQHPEKRFGNEESPALLKERDEYTATMERIQAELASLRASTNATQEENIKIQAEIKDIREKLCSATIPLINLRKRVMEDRRIDNRGLQCKDRETTIVRNEVAHGGDILSDIKTIQHVQENGLRYASEYKEDFQSAYGIAFNDAVAKTPSYPQEVIRAFDIRVSLIERTPWQDEAVQEDRAKIEKLAAEIIEAALGEEREQLQTRFEKGDLSEKFIRMDRMFKGEKEEVQKGKPGRG